MKKLIALLAVLLCAAALATPVYADIASPAERVIEDHGWIYALIGAVVLIAGIVLFLLLRKKKK